MFTGPIKLAKQPEWLPDWVAWVWLSILVLSGLVYVIAYILEYKK